MPKLYVLKNTAVIFFILFTSMAFGQSPAITSFSPASAVSGTTVTITGANFNTTAANDIVFFGATKATVSTATATSLTVAVPTGATYAPVTVVNTANNLAAYSATNFLPTYTPHKTSIKTTDFTAKADLPTGAGPSSVAIGDLTGDGLPDLAIANNSDNSVSVLVNTIR